MTTGAEPREDRPMDAEQTCVFPADSESSKLEHRRVGQDVMSVTVDEVLLTNQSDGPFPMALSTKQRSRLRL